MKIKNISRFIFAWIIMIAPIKAYANDSTILDKTIEKEGQNYRIHLNVQVSESEKIITPSDTILVLDTSGSMQDGNQEYKRIKEPLLEIDYKNRLIYVKVKNNYYRIVENVIDSNTEVAFLDISDNHALYELYPAKEKLSQMKKAVIQFIDLVAQTNSENRIAIVDFGSEVKNNTTSQDFLLASDPILKEMIQKMNANGATRIDLGLKKAQQFQFDPTHIQNVIVFTDGVPTKQNTFDDEVANEAIQYADEMAANKISVFSIGVKLENEEERIHQFMIDLASQDHFTYTIDSMDELEAVLEEVQNSTKNQVYRTVIDGLSDEVEIIEESIQEEGIYDEATRTITWPKAEVSKGWETSFLVKLSSLAPKEGTFPSNKNHSGVKDDQNNFIPFPIPTITLENSPIDPKPIEPTKPNDTETPIRPRPPQPPVVKPKPSEIPIQPEKPISPILPEIKNPITEKPTVPGLIQTYVNPSLYREIALVAVGLMFLTKRKK